MASKRQDESSENLRRRLRHTRVPLLTLDEKWHEVMPEEYKTDRARALEKHLNELIRSQGQLGNDVKDLRKLKKKLMNEIIDNMGEEEGQLERLREKKQDKYQKLIKEINAKITAAEENLEDCPDEIKQTNEALLFECIRIWYEQMESNTALIETLEQRIWQMREDLKHKLLVKQDREIQNDAIYSYMHSLLGADIMEQLDEKRRTDGE